jgi:predicted amidophosphoribosyltransferase
MHSGVSERCAFCQEWLPLEATRCWSCGMPHRPVDPRELRRSVANGSDE